MDNLNEAQLKALVNVLAWNDGYGCYTRSGFEKLIWPNIADKARWVIFFDIDDMHDLNEEHGYEQVNAIIRQSLKMRETDFMAGQWFSGDEFIVIVTDEDAGRRESNPIEFCVRLAEIFRADGAPATFAIAPILSNNLLANVEPAHKLCQQNKRENKRGGISIVPGEPR
jgi:GGDEF domain-containing protein